LLATAAVLAAAAIGLTFKRPQAAPFSQIKVTRLTSGGQSFKAAISPDGRYIAHTVLEAGRESLLVRRSNTVHDVEIGPPGPVRYVGITFAPDSETIYYAVNQAGQPAALSRIPVMGGAAERIKDSLDSPISFSPDGKKYAFVRESAGRSALLEADLASGAERTLVVHELPAALDYPAWSPDGRVIAYTMYDAVTSSRAGSGARVMEVRVADGSERQISNQTLGFIRELAWLGDGSGLVMSARAGDPGFFHLWYVSYPDGVTRKITDGLNYQTGVAVSASAPRQLVTVEQSLFSSLWRLRTFAGDAERVTPGVSGTSAPAWTPDGRIVFEEELNGQRSLWVVDSGGTNRTQLTVAGNSYSPSVSKDGRRIAFMSDRSGSPAIWTMNIDGGNPALVLKAGGDTTPQFSPDGRWIVFTAVGSRHWNTLWRIAASGGKPAELNEDLWFAPAVSPDGEWVAGFYSKGALSTQSKPFLIAVVGIGGGEPHTKIPIPPSVVAGAGLRWSPDSRELIYVDSGQDGANLWSRPWTGGPPRQLTHFRGATLFSFDLSRDGQQIAFNQGRQARDVILIEDAAR
jgi:Tol biopolymer transport system component